MGLEICLEKINEHIRACFPPAGRIRILPGGWEERDQKKKKKPHRREVGKVPDKGQSPEGVGKDDRKQKLPKFEMGLGSEGRGIFCFCSQYEWGRWE